MTSQEIRLLAIRLLGLYQGAGAVQTLSQAIAFAIANTQGFENVGLMYLNWAAIGAAYGIVCFFCLAETEAIINWVFADLLGDETAPEKRQRPFSMAFFVALLGLYFVVSSAGQAVVTMIGYITNTAGGVSGSGVNMLWSLGTTFALGLALLIGATSVERTITGLSP